MSTDLSIHGAGEAVVTHDTHNGHHEEHHHKETFITKYVFSQDHKMISKQFLMEVVIRLHVNSLNKLQTMMLKGPSFQMQI